MSCEEAMIVKQPTRVTYSHRRRRRHRRRRYVAAVQSLNDRRPQSPGS